MADVQTRASIYPNIPFGGLIWDSHTHLAKKSRTAIFVKLRYIFSLPPGNATYSQIIRLLTCDLWASISVLSAGMCLQPLCGTGVPVLCGFTAVCYRLCGIGKDITDLRDITMRDFFCEAGVGAWGYAAQECPFYVGLPQFVIACAG